MNLSQSSENQVDLIAVVSTAQLYQRVSRRPDYEAENRALVSLAQVLAHPPRDILQRLVEKAIELCQGGSAGISIIEDHLGEKVFRWHALTGALAAHRWGTTPRDFSPCGTVIDSNAVQLMVLPERHFLYFANVKPQIVEALLVPFSVRGQPVGTIWVVTHDDRHNFDAEDERIIKELGDFATEAYQLASSVQTSKIADRRKDDFLATVAHELRNPLSAISNAMYAIKGHARCLNEPQLQAMTELGERQITSMKRMIDNLLDVARIRLDKIELERGPVEIGELVQQAIEATRSAIDARRHELTVSVLEGPIWLQADAARVTQILVNLLSNAAKYTPEGGHISLSAQRHGTELLIRIQDDGIGISQGMLSRVFDLFDQGDIKGERANGGLGIGLSLVRTLAQMHGGTVHAYSGGRGKGSEFVVRLPMFAASLPANAPVAPAAPHAVRTIRPSRAAPSAAQDAAAPEPARFVQRMREGDQGALSELYEATVGSVYAVAMAILKSTQDAEEVVCDTYAQAWRQSERFDAERSTPVGWLLMMCRSRALDRLRYNRSRRAAKTVTLDCAEELVEESLRPDELLALFHDGSRVQNALAALSPRRLELVGLAFFEGLSFPEMAARTGMPLGTVKSHVRRSLAELRRKLE